jgi:hypothetical protein
MTELSASAPPKLWVSQTVLASYAIVAGNLGQLVRISWLWVVIMVPVYAALDRLDEAWLGESGPQARYHWMRVITAALGNLVDLPLLASIAVAWHRLVLRGERITQPAYLRLDGVVWRYALYAFAFLPSERGILAAGGFLVQNLVIDADYFTRLLIEFLATATSAAVSIAIGLLVLPRLSLVMPATALRERLSLRYAWRISRGNTLRLGMATALCTFLPAVAVATLVSSLTLLDCLDFSWSQIVTPQWASAPIWRLAIELSEFLAYAVFVALAYLVLTIFGVTLLSLSYRFFTVPSEGRPSTVA